MKAIVASGNQSFATQLVHTLNTSGISCSPSNVVSDPTSVLEVLAQDASGLLILLDATNDHAEVLSSVEVLSRTTGALIVVAGASDNAGEVLNFVRSGAHDYIDARADLTVEIGSLLERLSAKRVGAATSGKLFSVTSCGGGSGASTIATNMAALLAADHGSCGLIDLHPCGGDLAGILQLEPDYTLLDVAKKGDALDAAMLRKSIVRHDSGISLLASPEPFLEERGIPAKTMHHILATANKEFPFVVTDLEDMFHHEQTLTLKESDAVVIVFRLDFISLLRTRKSIAHLTGKAKVAKEKLHLVAGCCGQPRELSVGSAEQVLGHPVMASIPYDAAAALAAMNIGAPVVSEVPNSKLAKAMRKLTACLAGQSDEHVERTGRLSKRVFDGAAAMFRIAAV